MTTEPKTADALAMIRAAGEMLETIISQTAREIPVVSNVPKASQPAEWMTARIEDIASYPAEKTEVDFTWDDVVSHDNLVASLAHPFIGASFDAIWDNNISKQLQGMGYDPSEPDEALAIAENRSPTGLATTSLCVRSTDTKEEVSVHLIIDKANHRALIVGESVAPSLKAAFNKAGITYVDRNTRGAEAKVKKALNEMTGGTQQRLIMGSLTDAFKYRNDVAASSSRPLSELLVDRNVAPLIAKYLVKNPAPTAQV